MPTESTRAFLTVVVTALDEGVLVAFQAVAETVAVHASADDSTTHVGILGIQAIIVDAVAEFRCHTDEQSGCEKQEMVNELHDDGLELRQCVLVRDDDGMVVEVDLRRESVGQRFREGEVCIYVGALGDRATALFGEDNRSHSLGVGVPAKDSLR